MRLNSTVLALIVSVLGSGLATGAGADPLAETREAKWSVAGEPDLRDKANELGSAVAIYEFVRNEFAFTAYDGARSNSINTFLHRRGNDVDLATLLIAMLRSQGIPARYADAVAVFNQNDVTSWLEVPDPNAAANLLLQAGFRNVGTGTGVIQFRHAWVQALVPLDQYRAAGPAAAIDCGLQPAQCTWVDLDPAFKLHRFRDPAELVDVSSAVAFDYNAYYRAEDSGFTPPDGLDRREKGPLEVYEEQILRYLQTTPALQGRTLEDVVYQGEVVPERHGLLPTSLAFRVNPANVVTYDSVVEHDAAVGASLAWTKTVSFQVRFPRFQPLAHLTLSGGPAIPLVDLSTENLTFAYESTNFASTSVPKQLVARVGGQVHQVIFTLTNRSYTSTGGNGTIAAASPLPEVGTPFDVILSMKAAGGATISATYPSLTLGGYYLVATGGDHSSWSQVHRSAGRLLQAVADNPVVENASGVLIVDLDRDGVADAGEPKLLESASTQILLTGGVLAMAKDLYYARIRDAIERVADLQRSKMPPSGFLGIVSSVHDVHSVAGTAFEVIPAGLLVDMKGIQVAQPFKIDAANSPNDDIFRLGGHIISSLEHEIWQELTGYEAISTMKGIQRTLADGATLMVLDEAQSQVSLATALANWGFQQNVPSGINTQHLNLFGLRLWLPRSSNSTDRTLSVIREVVTTSTPAELRLGWDLEVTNQGSDYEAYFRWFEDLLSDLSGLPDSTPLQSPTNIATLVGFPGTSGCVTATTVGQLRNNAQPCFFALLARPELQPYEDYVDYFDTNAGFVVGDNLYRLYDPAVHIRATSVAPIRNEIVFGADPDGNGTPNPDDDVEFVVPSRVADGELIDFAVWIQRYFDVNDSEYSSSYIINRAGGGYVSGANPINIYNPITSGFNNQLFTDISLSSYTNNSFYTPSTFDPISTVTGNVYHDEQDLRIRGRGELDFQFTRTFNSGPTLANANGLPMGHKWTHSYNMRLIARDHTQTPNSGAAQNTDNVVSSIVYVDERGGESTFGVSGSGAISGWTVTRPRGVFDTLDLSQAPTTYTLRFRNGTEYVFGNANLASEDAVARLNAIRDAYGNQLTLTYNASGRLASVQDNLGVAGRTGLSFLHDANGRLVRITDWNGRQWNYAYDAAGNLTSYSNPLAHVTRYAYAPGTRLLTRVERPESRDGNAVGDVVTTFSYYTNERGFGNANSFGHGEQVDYDLFRKRTRITDARGFVTSQYYDTNGELTKLTEPDGGVLQFKHNPNGRRFHKQDAMGFTTLYSYCTAQTFTGCAVDAGQGGKVTAERDPLGGTTKFLYSSALFDQVVRIEDPNGAVTNLSYHPADDGAAGAKRGKLWQVRMAALGGASNVLLREFKYNLDGTLRERIDYIEPGNTTRRRTTTYTYTANGLNLQQELVTGTDGTSRRRTFTYDTLGRLSTERLERRVSPTDATPVQLVTTYAYDAMDRVASVTDPLGNRTETSYDKNGNAVERRYVGRDPQTGAALPARVRERRKYDAADRVIEVRDAEDGVTTYGYDEAGNQTRVTDPSGVTRYLEYDERNRLVAVVDENGHRTETFYDLNGRVVAEVDGNGNRASYSYDAAGRVTARSDALNNRTTFRYDAKGNPVGQKNANANAQPGNLALVNNNLDSVTRVYDELGRLTRTIDALDQATVREYDLLGNVTRITDGKLQVTQFVYDDLGRVKEVVDPIVEAPTDRRQTFQYDQAGNPIQAADRVGNSVRTTYDLLNRPTQREYPTSSEIETVAYDAFGNVERLSNDEVTYTFDYDRNNRLVSKVDSRLGRSIFVDWDAAGRPERKTDYQGDETRYLYDGAGRLIAEQSSGYLEVSYHYDDGGRLLNRILSNGARTDYAYDAANRLTSLSNRSGAGTVVHSSAYGYDAVGNVTTAGGATFTYDPLHRLIGADYANNAFDRSYSYDPVGNRETETNAQGAFDYVYGAGNRLLQIRRISDNALIHSFDYDPNGSITAKRNGAGTALWSLGYDDRGRVSTANGPGFSHGYGYDPEGLRVRRDDTLGAHLFHLEGEHLEAVYAPGGALRAKYLRGAIIDEVVNGYLYDAAGNPGNYTFHHDQVTSVVALTGHTGSLDESTGYAPFGETLVGSPTTANALRYTGRERDPGTGLYYYRARYYDPAIGRFLSEDPLGFASGDVNFYAYVGNNPLGFNDPRGEALETAWDVVNVGIGGASLAGNLASGNYGWAAVDALGLAYDLTATAIPFLPGGASAGLRAFRAGNAVYDSVNVGLDVARTADIANTAARLAPVAGNPMTIGRQIHTSVGNALDTGNVLSDGANNFFRGANGATGPQPDLSWNTATGVWADLTTAGSWNSHVTRYGDGGIPLLYERGVGLTNMSALPVGASSVALGSQLGYSAVSSYPSTPAFDFTSRAYCKGC
jgi:RHS repeat-associated protein